MARSFNKLTLIGYLGHEPDMRYTPEGQAVTTFSVAVNSRRQVEGQTRESTQWFRVSARNRLAEIAAEDLHKGTSVFVEGPLQMRPYVGRDGQQRVSLDVTARELQTLSGRAGAPSAQDDAAEAQMGTFEQAADSGSATDALDEPPF